MATRLCPHFIYLQRRVNSLREKFIGDQIKGEENDPAGFQPDFDRLAAFRLLVHAELEEFLEVKAKEGLNKLEADFRSGLNNMRSNTLIFILSAYFVKPGESLTLFPTDSLFSIDKWENFFFQTLSIARKFICSNNGVKKYAFTRLALLSGKMPDELDMTLALNLDHFGRTRGDVAHSSAPRVRTLRAPSAEASEVDGLIKALDAFFN